MQPVNFCIALCIVALLSVMCSTAAQDNNDNKDNNDIVVSSTTVKSVFLSQFDKIITRMEKTKDRINRVLNETRQNDIKSRDELLIGKGYQYTEGIGYHKLYNRKLSWYDALHRCRREDAHLAIIDSSAEVTALKMMVKEKLLSAPGEESVAYVGYHDYCANSWIDVFFKPLSANENYISWKVGVRQPSEPDCAAIDENGYLHNSACTVKQAFICEVAPHYGAV